DGSGYEAYVGRWSRRVAERFLPWLEAPHPGTWIDLGCGTSVLTRAILELEDPTSVLGVDPSVAFLASARNATPDSRATFVPGRAGSLPLPDRSADVGVAGLVLLR
ncbi:MAG TPA: class I SAM-dependent methyltransferase, partial [Candidatus Limnocylindrales bacterium]|nr:class I SAM-dependent methyltransferase [Candidatus Limnocylindrales bacterium]